jgi:hypothetical protein
VAFVITEDHARQEVVYGRLSYNRDASTIRRLLTETHVAATDRRAVLVGVEAYTEAGGTILRDLFTEDRGGYFEDVALLDLLVTAKLGRWTAPTTSGLPSTPGLGEIGERVRLVPDSDRSDCLMRRAEPPSSYG